MNKLLIVAPNASIYQSAMDIVTEAQLDAKVIQATSEHIVDIVRKEFANDTGVVVARGHQAQLVKSQLTVPVVDIVLSGMDMIILLDHARRILDRPRPRIAFVGFRYMFPDCSPLADIMDVDPYIYYASTGREVPDVVEQAAADGAALIIGGEMACQHAARLGLPSLFMDSMKESVRTAIRTAMHTLDATVLEQRRSAEFSSLLNYSFDAILKLDSDGRIEAANHLAEKMLRQPMPELQGKRFFDMPTVQITPVLAEAIAQHRSLYSTIIRIGSDSFVANIASVDVEGRHDGFIVSMQEFGVIDDLEETIRVGRRQQGYVAAARFESFTAHAPRSQALLRDAKQYAQYDIPLLLCGPGGLPKSELAQCIHNASLRKRSPFVKAELSTIPIAAQTEFLFGSDVVPTSRGLISIAHTGTLFLLDAHLLTDESQHQLLNVLRNGHYFRKGNTSSTPVSVRVICATFKDLNALAAEDRFSEPLVNTLTSVMLQVPALREVPEDIPHMLAECLDRACAKYKKPLMMTADATALLTGYDWPGNLREMRTLCERAVMLATSQTIDAAFVRERLLPAPAPDASPAPVAPVLVVADPEELALRNALREAGDNRLLAAERLGVSRSTLWRRMKKYGLA